MRLCLQMLDGIDCCLRCLVLGCLFFAAVTDAGKCKCVNAQLIQKHLLVCADGDSIRGRNVSPLHLCWCCGDLLHGKRHCVQPDC